MNKLPAGALPELLREAEMPAPAISLPRPPSTAMGATGEDLLEAILPLLYAEGETNDALTHWVGALSQLLDPVAEMVRDDDEGNAGWTALASPRRCMAPWLHVLAQWAGIRRWDAVSDDDLRALIGPRAPGVWRGTRAAMLAAVRRFLPPGTSDRLVLFVERADGDPYLLRIFTYDFVPHDSNAVREALLAAKPALLNLEYEVRQGQTYGMLHARMDSYAEMHASYPNYWAVLHAEPI